MSFAITGTHLLTTTMGTRAADTADTSAETAISIDMLTTRVMCRDVWFTSAIGRLVGTTKYEIDFCFMLPRSSSEAFFFPSNR